VFWKQLKLEGHKNDFLQDYRLALLDAAWLTSVSMYRRSVPPDVPLRVAPEAVACDGSDDASQLPSQEVISMSPRKTYILKLYVAGNTPNSMRALKTLAQHPRHRVPRRVRPRR
jgi:hypothetical protein